MEILENIGLTKGEIKIYLALLELGQTTAGPIRKKTKVQNSVVHLCLNSLIEKSLVNYVKKGRKKFYTATKPENILTFIEEKKRRVEEMIPTLLEKQKEQARYDVSVYEGEKGFKAVQEDLLRELRSKDEFLVLGAPKEAQERFETYFQDFHKRRIRKRVELRIIYKKDAKEYVAKRNRLKFTQAKYLNEKLLTPMWTTVYNNKTILFVAGDIFLSIVIENKTIADNFREFFELVWKISNPK